MKGKLVISLFFIIFLVIGLSGCLGTTHLKTISKQVNVPYSSGLTGNAGTLYCNGIIHETTGGVEYIKLTWKADLVFPDNAVAGYLAWGNFWNHPMISTKHLYIDTPDENPGPSHTWCDAKGEYHIWEMQFTIYQEYITIKTYDNGVEFLSLDSRDSGIVLGYDDIFEGCHTISSAVGYNPICTDIFPEEMETFLTTPLFQLVRSGANYWFE